VVLISNMKSMTLKDMFLKHSTLFFMYYVLSFMFDTKLVSADEYILNEPLIGVKELSEQGRYFDSILLYKENESVRSLGDTLAVAKSAWAIGLVDEARIRWDQALEHPDCKGVERARVLLSRAIMELQEGSYDRARGFAEEGSTLVNSSELRGELNFVIAEALYSQGMYSLAERYYEKVSKEGSKERVQESLLKLSKVMNKLGRFADARKVLTLIELTSSITPHALDELIILDSKNRNFSGVRTWVEEGRSSFPSEFRSSKISYIHAQSLIKEGLLVEAEEEISYISMNSKENDAWLQLGKSLIEIEHAKGLLEE